MAPASTYGPPVTISNASVHTSNPKSDLAVSPNSGTNHLSPRGSTHMKRANSNPFAPLSPDLPENSLSASSQALKPSHLKSGRVQSYSRKTLLKIARQCEKRGWQVPADLAPLSTWYGWVEFVHRGGVTTRCLSQRAENDVELVPLRSKLKLSTPPSLLLGSQLEVLAAEDSGKVSASAVG